jgi:hypothetical protein
MFFEFHRIVQRVLRAAGRDKAEKRQEMVSERLAALRGSSEQKESRATPKD